MTEQRYQEICSILPKLRACGYLLRDDECLGASSFAPAILIDGEESVRSSPYYGRAYRALINEGVTFEELIEWAQRYFVESPERWRSPEGRRDFLRKHTKYPLGI